MQLPTMEKQERGIRQYEIVDIMGAYQENKEASQRVLSACTIDIKEMLKIDRARIKYQLENYLITIPLGKNQPS